MAIKPNARILDVCCGGRMMHFDKSREDVIFMDIRTVPPTQLCDGRTFECSPDIQADFRNIPFQDGRFDLVLFDPPHLVRVGDTAYMGVKYGRLNRDTWKEDLSSGFQECMRVLRPGGTLIFKWSEVQIQVHELTRLFGIPPLVGHKSGRKMNTHWLTYYKHYN